MPEHTHGVSEWQNSVTVKYVESLLLSSKKSDVREFLFYAKTAVEKRHV